MGCGSSKNKIIDPYVKREITTSIRTGSSVIDSNRPIESEQGSGSIGNYNHQRSLPKSAWGNTFLNGIDPGDAGDPRSSSARSTVRWLNVARSSKTGTRCSSGDEMSRSDDDDDGITTDTLGESIDSKISSRSSSSGFEDSNAVKVITEIRNHKWIANVHHGEDNTISGSNGRQGVPNHQIMSDSTESSHSLSSSGSKKNVGRGTSIVDRSRTLFETFMRTFDAKEETAEQMETSSSNEEVLSVPKVITHLAKSHRSAYYRHHFWWNDKKNVVPDYLRLAELDAHALKARGRMEPKELAADLTNVCETKVEEIRVIFRWVAANIAYKKMDPTERVAQTSLFVYRRKFGNCLGFCNLLKYLLNFGEIGCEVIDGIAKGASYVPGTDLNALLHPEAPGRHCWNRIEIDECWFLCDVTWAREHDMNAEGEWILKPSRFKEIWFLTDPEIFIKNHLPLMYDEYDEQFLPDLDEQHLYRPCHSVEDWDAQVWITASAMEWGIKPVSHHEAIIWSQENYVEIIFECPTTMTYTYSLTDIETGKSFQGYTMIYATDSALVKGHVKLPKKGSYILRIQGSPRFEADIISQDKDDSDVILTYRIEATGTVVNEPYFSGRNPAWGITSEFLETGCSIIDYKGAIYHTDTGIVSITIKIPTLDIFPHMINYTSVTHPDDDLANKIYTERDGHHIVFNIICPKIGDYLFSFWLKNRPDTDHLDTSLNIFLQSTMDACDEFSYPPHPSIWGAQEPIHSLRIVPLFPKSSTLVAQDGECVIAIELLQHIHVSHRLLDENGVDCKDWKRCVYAEQDGDRLNYYFLLPERGRFQFKIAGGKLEEHSHQVALVYLIENLDKPYEGPLFPEHENFPWGIRNEFIQLGLGCDQVSSTIPVVNQEAKLQIKLPDMKSVFKAYFTHADRPNENLNNYCVLIRNKNLTDITIVVRLPTPGYYALRLFEAKYGTSLAIFLLESKSDDTPRNIYGFEPHSGIYGATEAFLERGLQMISDMTSEFETQTDGKCKIILKAPMTLDLLLIVKNKGKEVKGHLMPLRHEERVTFIFQGKNAGYYQLKGYAKGSKRKSDVLFVFLIHVVDDFLQFEPFPETNVVWGLNKESEVVGIRVLHRSGVSQSLIHENGGLALITFHHPVDSHVTGWLRNPTQTEDNLQMRVFSETDHETSTLTVSLPHQGYFTLKIGAAKTGATKFKTVGTLLIHSKSDEGRDIAFPEFTNLFDGCKLESPLVSSLLPNTEHKFKIKIPNAEKVRLWEDGGQWKFDLNAEGGDTFCGTIDVGETKNLWVTARFPKESPRGEEGRYRNMIMYKVISTETEIS